MRGHRAACEAGGRGREARPHTCIAQTGVPSPVPPAARRHRLALNRRRRVGDAVTVAVAALPSLLALRVLVALRRLRVLIVEGRAPTSGCALGLTRAQHGQQCAHQPACDALPCGSTGQRCVQQPLSGSRGERGERRQQRPMVWVARRGERARTSTSGTETTKGCWRSDRCSASDSRSHK